MIGPFSTTLVPLSSSSSVDRQVLINVEASAISPDERTFGFIFTKIPFTRRSKKKKKKKDQGAWSRSPVLSVCLRPPKKKFSTSRHWSWALKRDIINLDLIRTKQLVLSSVVSLSKGNEVDSFVQMEHRQPNAHIASESGAETRPTLNEPFSSIFLLISSRVCPSLFGFALIFQTWK